MITLTAAETDCAVYVFAEFERRRRIAGQPVPASARTLRQRLTAVAATGRTPEPARAPSKPAEQIDTTEAARLLGCSTRHVRRLAADLDGTRLGQQWIFPRHTVIDYHESRNTP
ncbi:helix-turn-helix domain-containing protein [Gordonia sp. i37]|uniref:helix-turn-helix domain-containing protein n=1 Tax=Gordonia sp. i37 TaxID=1961707 RepID=UPI0009AD8DEB|nr:helix-turn-helix domain-containing protein [Gordonia sp. i37]OPX17034.1 hypothetical protein B1964_01775 [Gordonia sp. i37]